MATDEVTIGIRELKARLSQIIAGLDGQTDVVITRHGRPCAKLTSFQAPPDPGTASLASLRDRLPRLADASYEDFQGLKSIWVPEAPADARRDPADG